MRSATLVIVILALLNLRVYGWWDTGHMLVAEISWKHITANSSNTQWLQTALSNAIEAMPTYSTRTNDYVTSACWMDDIKSRGISQFSGWHFINIPVCGFPDPENCTDNPDYVSINEALDTDDNVVWAIGQAMSTIKNKNAIGFERGFALRNLLHLIGDIHQPLHVVDRYGPNSPNGDAGGNGFHINLTWANNNLHGLWDGAGGLYATTFQRPLNQSTKDYLSQQADLIIASTVITPGESDDLNVTAWALESLSLSEEYVYANITPGATPSEEYLLQAQNISMQRIGLAGYRLALVLQNFLACNDATGNCPTDTPVECNDKKRDYKASAIGLAVLSGVLLLAVVFLAYRLRRASHYRNLGHDETTRLYQ